MMAPLENYEEVHMELFSIASPISLAYNSTAKQD